jgi:hypothetical protein
MHLEPNWVTIFLKCGLRSRGVNIFSLIINFLTSHEGYIEMEKSL